MSRTHGQIRGKLKNPRHKGRIIKASGKEKHVPFTGTRQQQWSEDSRTASHSAEKRTINLELLKSTAKKNLRAKATHFQANKICDILSLEILEEEMQVVKPDREGLELGVNANTDHMR